MSQKKFAEEIGVSRSVVSNYEAGRRLPNDEIIKSIAKIGRKAPAWIMTGSSSESDNKQFEILEKFFRDIINKDEQSRSLKSLISDEELSLIILIR